MDSWKGNAWVRRGCECVVGKTKAGKDELYGCAWLSESLRGRTNEDGRNARIQVKHNCPLGRLVEMMASFENTFENKKSIYADNAKVENKVHGHKKENYESIVQSSIEGDTHYTSETLLPETNFIGVCKK